MATSNTSLVRGSVADILGFQATEAEQKAAGKGQAATAQGYGLEIDAYASAQEIAEYNASLEAIAGDIRVLQSQREVNRSLGAARAASAAAGFAESGSTVDILRSSVQEGYLEQQLLRTQSAIDQAGYLGEARAASFQSSAASIARQSALDTQAANEEAASLAGANAAAETAALTRYLQDFGTTEETDLATGVLGGTDVGETLERVSAGGTVKGSSPFTTRTGFNTPPTRRFSTSLT